MRDRGHVDDPHRGRWLTAPPGMGGLFRANRYFSHRWHRLPHGHPNFFPTPGGHKVMEVNRPGWHLRRMNGKSRTLDDESAVRTFLAAYATAVAKSTDGAVDMIRLLKIVHDTAGKARAATMATLKAVLVHAIDMLRHTVAGRMPVILAGHLAPLRPQALASREDARRHTIRSLA